MTTVTERFNKRCAYLFTQPRPTACFNPKALLPTMHLLNGVGRTSYSLIKEPTDAGFSVWVSHNGADPVGFSSYAELRRREPTAKLVNELEGAEHYPLQCHWGVVENGRIVELLLLQHMALSDGPPPYDFLVVTQDRLAQTLQAKLALPSGWLNMAELWRAITSKQLVPVSRQLQTTRFEFGVTPQNGGAYVIGDELLLHPKAWRAWPSGSVAGLRDKKDMHFLVQ